MKRRYLELFFSLSNTLINKLINSEVFFSIQFICLFGDLINKSSKLSKCDMHNSNKSILFSFKIIMMEEIIISKYSKLHIILEGILIIISEIYNLNIFCFFAKLNK